MEGLDHLSQIAGIRQSQITKLNTVGISTMQQLVERRTIEGTKIEEKSLRKSYINRSEPIKHQLFHSDPNSIKFIKFF